MKLYRNLVLFLIVSILVVGIANAELSVQLKRTNPGIAKEKSAEIIFDVVNTDMTHKIEGFIWCRSPDDAVVSGTMGAASGSGAQYVSEKFFINKGPAQKSMSLTIDADSVGDKRTGCTIKYMPYQETEIEESEIVEQEEPISFDGEIGAVTVDVGGYMFTLVSYTAMVEAVLDEEETVIEEEVPATVVLDIDGTESEFEINVAKEIGDLTVTVTGATEDAATVTIEGKTIETTEEVTENVVKQYKKQNGEYTTTPLDGDYLELRLDKTVPFVAPSVKEPQCPETTTHCTANEVISGEMEIAGESFPIWVVVIIIVVILLVVYLLGKTSRK